MLRCRLLIRFLVLELIISLGSSLLYAITPPPLGETTYEKQGREYNDRIVNNYSAVISVSGTKYLTSSHTGGVVFHNHEAGSTVNLNWNNLVIDSSGIRVDNPWWSTINGYGSLTSSQRYLDIIMNTGTIMPDASGRLSQRGLDIQSVITGNMGLRLSGKHDVSGVVYLSGNQNNTFTGNVEIMGPNNYLVLRKINGAVAVQGDIIVNNWAVLRLDESQQVRTTSSVTLTNSTLYHSTVSKDLTTRFHRLTVSGSVGVISFGSAGTHTHKRYLYIDELVIEGSAHIEVNEWAPDRDFFLVRKTMNKEQLDALMSKIIFRGWLPGRTHLEDYDKDYWSISGTPEPTTYGAILGAVGLGLTVLKKRRRSPKLL